MGSWKIHTVTVFILVIALYLIQLKYKLNILPTDINFLLGIIPIIFIYGLGPDIDQIGHSRIGKIFLIASLISIIYFSTMKQWILIIIIAILTLILTLTGHRKWTHTLFASILFSLPLLIWLNYYYFIIAMISWNWHLILDKQFNIFPKIK